MKFIDNLLNRITMYRLVVYGLGILVALSVFFSLIGKLTFSTTDMIVSLVVLLAATYGTNWWLRRVWRVPTNSESWLITALILFLIIQPANTFWQYVVLALAGVLASASKFIVSWQNKHLFNPAAFAAAVLSISTLYRVSWWVGSTALWPCSLIIGLLIVRKIRRFSLVLTFAAVTVIVQALVFYLNHEPASWHAVLTASPLIFLGTIMLTEPATMPSRRAHQMIFAAGVAILYVTGWKIGPLYIYPEVALLLGNIYAFIVSPKSRVELKLVKINKISDRVYSYIFQPNRRLNFLPGQYMEWTLAGVPYDSRGNRRTFTLASSPTETTVEAGIKYYQPSSAYKRTFYQLKLGDKIFAGQIAGDFTLKGNEHKKLVFIAGGIGVTPFRSMAKYITDSKLEVDIVLLYVVADPQEFAFVEEFNAAHAQGLKVVPIVTQQDYQAKGIISAKLSSQLISDVVPDYAERLFYISGPNAMVDAAKSYLKQLGVAMNHIKTDHFSGY